MRILFCSPHPIDPRRGAAKVYIEVAAAFQRIGWDTTVLGPEETRSAAGLRAYLRAHAGHYDVVEYEHNRLPFPRRDFAAATLLVARSVLLAHHLHARPMPPRPRLRSIVGHWLLWPARHVQWTRIVAHANRTCREADLVNVPNTDDVAALVAHGVPRDKIVVFPFGLTRERREALGRAAERPATPTVAFLGTFDPRKGMRDLPDIAARVCRLVPGARLKLLGTRGMVPDAAGVLDHFSRDIRGHVDVVPHFEPDELPALLAGCAVGVFPSAVEGFPFGVLEMLAAGLPVVAYRVPGPAAILSDESLVPRGDTSAMAARVTAHLRDPVKLGDARRSALARAGDFAWDDIARGTSERYERALADRRAGRAAGELARGDARR